MLGIKRRTLSRTVILSLLVGGNLLVCPPRVFSQNKERNKAQDKLQGNPKAAAVKLSQADDFEAGTIKDNSSTKVMPPSLVEEPNTTTRSKSEEYDIENGGELNESKKPAVKQPSAKPLLNESEAEESAPQGADKSTSLTTTLNGSEIEISTLAKAFSKITKRNYIVDNTVKGKVAIHLATAVSVPEALKIFESVLLLKGFTTVPMGANTWKIISAKDARQTTIPTITTAGDSSNEALVTRLIRLKNTQAADLQQILAQFVSKDGAINSFAATNSLIIIDSSANIKRLSNLVSQLDVPALDQDITIIPINHADAKDLSEKINKILGGDAEADQSASRSAVNLGRPNFAIPPPNIGQLQASNSGVNVKTEQRQLPIKLIPDERTNSLIVVADQILTEKVKALVEQLDSEVDRSGGKFYVYRLQHADATEVADILSSLITGSPQSSGKSTSGVTGALGSSSSSSGFGLGSRSRDRSSTRSDSAENRLASAIRQSSPFFSTAGQSDAGKVNLEGEVTVAADNSTNSLVINASRGDYNKIKELLTELDVKRRQVLVEATILEVSLSNAEGMGVEWQTTAGTDQGGMLAQTNYGGFSNLLTNPKSLSDLTIAAASSGSIVLPGGLTLPSQAILVTALSKNQNVNVLSTPTILAIDNQEAEIKVGENVPFVTAKGTNQTNLNNTFNEIERQDVGIKLRITPQISAGDYVVLKIFVEISNVVSGTRNDPNGPTTTIRTTETMVEVKSEQMVVTGGLIADSVTDSSRGVPYFEDIPVLGHLFRRDDSERRRNNLLVFITPRIISDQFVAREKTMAQRDKLEKIIEKEGAEPDRKEVLRSSEINQVVEVSETPLVKPSVVRPGPALAAESSARGSTRRAAISNQSGLESAAVARTNQRIEAIAAQPARAKDEEELEVTVAPSLPKSKK